MAAVSESLLWAIFGISNHRRHCCVWPRAIEIGLIGGDLDTACRGTRPHLRSARRRRQRRKQTPRALASRFMEQPLCNACVGVVFFLSDNLLWFFRDFRTNYPTTANCCGAHSLDASWSEPGHVFGLRVGTERMCVCVRGWRVLR